MPPRQRPHSGGGALAIARRKGGRTSRDRARNGDARAGGEARWTARPLYDWSRKQGACRLSRAASGGRGDATRRRTDISIESLVEAVRQESPESAVGAGPRH